jgi:D-3-phosphoglycerate dehydrogenase
MKKVLLVNPTIQPCGVEILKSGAEVVMAPDGEEDTLISFLSTGDFSAIVVRVEKITQRVIENSRGLEVIGQPGVGVDNIDVQAATEKEIMVVNAPTANYVSTAEHAVMMMLALARKLPESDKAVRKNDFKFRERFFPIEMNGKDLLVVGLGRIGSEVAKKCRMAFNMNIMAYDPNLYKFEMAAQGVNKVDLEDGLKSADFVSLHIPAVPGTRHLIGKKEISLMKPTAFLVNASRGTVINQDDIVIALRENRIAGVGLDVFDPEPPQHNDPLLELPNVILSPHFAGDTFEAKQNCATSVSKEVIAVLEGRKPRFLVNPEVLGRNQNG